MCKFKSGIILKNHCVVAEESDDSHSNLLKKLGIEDTIANAMTKFVRVELLPPVDEKDANGKWWTDPDTWKINVDQDILPDWYEADPEKYNEEFRTAVKDWWSKHVRVGQEIEELSEGFYLLKDCRVKSLQKRVEVVLNDSTVGKMYGDSMVKEMYSDSVVQRMYNNSTIQEMCGDSTVKEMHGHSTIQEMYGNSTVKEMRGDSTVKEMYDHSAVKSMRNDSTIQKMCGDSTVKEMHGNTTVKRMCDNTTVNTLYGKSMIQAMTGNSEIKTIKDNAMVRDCRTNKIKMLLKCVYEIVKL